MQVSQRSRVVLFGRFLFWSILVCLCMCLVVECFFFRDRYVFFQVVLGYLDCLGSNASFQLHRAVRSLLCCFWLFYVLVDRSGQLKSFSLFSSVSGCFTSCQRCLSSFFFFQMFLLFFVFPTCCRSVEDLQVVGECFCSFQIVYSVLIVARFVLCLGCSSCFWFSKLFKVITCFRLFCVVWIGLSCFGICCLSLVV